MSKKPEQLKVLELFAGSRSIGQAAEKLGFTVFSIDYKDFDKIDLQADIEFLQAKDIPFVPDIVWASPDCTTYSLAAISHHRNGCLPKSAYAVKSDRVNQNMLRLIQLYLAVNPSMKFYIENPRGMLRKMPWMQGIPRTTITYCSYGDSRMKPTDIWSNNIHSLFYPGWKPRPMCHNGNRECHHEAAPRGSKTGTQGLKGAYMRSKIPPALCSEVLIAAAHQKKIETINH
jgi:site-specific DNA-cytosine methylase